MQTILLVVKDNKLPDRNANIDHSSHALTQKKQSSCVQVENHTRLLTDI